MSNMALQIKINNKLKFRLSEIEGFFVKQYLEVCPYDHKKLCELVSIKKRQLSLKELIEKEDDEDGGNAGGGRGTMKGLRAKDDPNRRSPFSTKMTRK